jgi:SulP family sulfate permease
VTERSKPYPAEKPGRTQWIGDVSGAFADLGTFLPLVIGLLILGAFDASGLLFGFGVFAIATGLIYRRPIPIQPMKAIAALAITGGMSAAAVTASGLIIGGVLLFLGATGLINHLQRAVPRTILFGIQIGLGLSLVLTSAQLAGEELIAALIILSALAALQFSGLRIIGCLIVLTCAVVWSLTFGGADLPSMPSAWHVPVIAVPDLPDFLQALETGVLPQLALTIANAVLLTAVIASDYFPQDKGRASARNLAFSSGGLNILLAPFGAIPMCHGAGGLAAQYGQGARTGLAPIVFGTACLALGLLAGSNALAWLSLIPIAAVAALLAFAGFQLLNVRRVPAQRPACLAIIGVTALVCVLVNVAAGLLIGGFIELLRSRWVREGLFRQPT